ncbi:MAG: YkgJ family cysteine cluster protein [Pelovirga sp.]
MANTDWRQEVMCARQDLDNDIIAIRKEYQDTGNTVYCRKSCGHCCSLAVNCSYPEAVVLAGSLTARQQDLVLAQVPLLAQLCRAAPDMKAFLQSYRHQAGSCPLIDSEDCCSCYSERPLSCRALLSTRPEAWCGIDFTTLHPLEKQAFLSSLNPDIVAYPSHYLARPLELAATLEKALDEKFSAPAGVKISGNMVWLLGLELNSQVSKRLQQQEEGIIDWLLQQQERYPYLIQVTAIGQGD